MMIHISFAVQLRMLKKVNSKNRTSIRDRLVAEVSGHERSVKLDHLLPTTRYQVYVTAVRDGTTGNDSQMVLFETEGMGKKTFARIIQQRGRETDAYSNNSVTTPTFATSNITVRAEEVLIVVLVLVLWVAAIALFINRWGKIRMLEPYQPKFHQEHRPSCSVGEVPGSTSHQNAVSKINVGIMEQGDIHGLRRSRQNSVFVGSTSFSTMPVNIPRRVKSAMDIQTLILKEESSEKFHIKTSNV